LIAIPSVIGDEVVVCDFCDEWLRRKNVHAITRAGDNLAFQPRLFREGVPSLLLLGHLDTVPVSDGNPARIEGDRIYGLGASDMKCADAVILHLMARAVVEEPQLNLAGVLYAREEGPYVDSGMPEILSAAPGCFEADLAIAMEPTDNRLELGCLGTMHARVKFSGKRAHSARPWHGKNAIHMAAPLLARLAALGSREVTFQGLLFREVCSATMIDFAGARNVVPGECAVNVNFRFAPDRDNEDAVAWLESFVRESVGEAAWDDVDFEVVDLCPSGSVCVDNELVAGLSQAADGTLETVAKQAWTDVGRLSNMGLDAINFGPGHTAQAHQVGEYASRALLAESCAVLERWLWPA
jgi:succinyl-diaminopimelate desuccinylase